MKPNARLEDPHLKVLDCIRSLIKEHHYAPTIAEICKKAGLHSKGTVAVHLRTLRDLGLVTWQPGHERTLVITDQGWFAYQVFEAFLDSRGLSADSLFARCKQLATSKDIETL